MREGATGRTLETSEEGKKPRNLIVMLIISCVYILKILENTETNVFYSRNQRMNIKTLYKKGALVNAIN